MLTDRILIWEELPRERFIDDHHSGAVFAVAFLKLAALPQRNGHRAKVIGRDVLKVRLSELCPGLPFHIEGRGQNDLGESNFKHIPPDYFCAMTIPFRQGRQFEERDSENGAGVVIINESFARQFFPNENPIGQHLTIGGNIGPDYTDRTREIVGVAGDLREESVDVPPAPMMFIPLAQRSDRLTLPTNNLAPASSVVKTRQNLLSKDPAVRAAVRAADPAQAVSNLRTMEEVLSQSLARQQFNMLLLSVFAG